VLQLLDLAAHLRIRGHFGGAIYPLRDLVDLLPQGIGFLVDKSGLRWLLAQIYDNAPKLRRSLAAVGPVARHDDGRAELADARFHEVDFGLRVEGEAVE